MTFFEISCNICTYVRAHTLGVAHCPFVTQRIYNFTGKGDADPELDPNYVKELKAICPPPPPATPATTVGLDRNSSLTFDSNYFVGLTKKQGLLTSDAALLTTPQTKGLVESFQDFQTFKEAFARSMLKMGAIGVLIGDQGEIRKKCRVIN